jgi:hypothetical protein
VLPPVRGDGGRRQLQVTLAALSAIPFGYGLAGMLVVRELCKATRPRSMHRSITSIALFTRSGSQLRR